MSNTIAVIWDCDKTLIDGYMQDSLFEHYNVSGREFWKSNAAEIEKSRMQGIRVNDDTFYLNSFIRAAHDGRFKGLAMRNSMNLAQNRNSTRGVPRNL
ncbi:MAG: hypothetical protein ACLTCV_02490 [Oscillospiraceae bacterium]